MPASKPKLPILNRAHPLARGLVGAWLFYEGSGVSVLDATGYRANGVFQGGAPTWVRPRRLSFGGSGSVRLSLGPQLEPGAAVSIVTRTNGAQNTRFVFCKGISTPSATYDYSLYSDTNGVGSLFYGASLKRSTSNNNFFDGSWHNLAVCASATATIFYKDGAQFGNAVSGAALPAGASRPALIGARPTNSAGTTNDFGYIGQVEYVFVYNRALTAGEVRALHIDPYDAFRPDLLVPYASFISAATAGSTAHLNWQDNSGDETGFSIERSATSAMTGFVEIDTVAANTTQYDDSGDLLSGTTYWYRVRAYRGSTYSDYSPVVEITTT